MNTNISVLSPAFNCQIRGVIAHSNHTQIRKNKGVMVSLITKAHMRINESLLHNVFKAKMSIVVPLATVAYRWILWCLRCQAVHFAIHFAPHHTQKHTRFNMYDVIWWCILIHHKHPHSFTLADSECTGRESELIHDSQKEREWLIKGFEKKLVFMGQRTKCRTFASFVSYKSLRVVLMYAVHDDEPLQAFTAADRPGATGGPRPAGRGWGPRPLHCCGGGSCGGHYSHRRNSTASWPQSCCRAPCCRNPCTCRTSSRCLEVNSETRSDRSAKAKELGVNRWRCLFGKSVGAHSEPHRSRTESKA